MSSPFTDNQCLHLILTRFNVRTGGKERSLRQNPSWLPQRFDLFERYCFPSVVAQTRKGFKWLVFFDAETPDEFKDRIRSYGTFPEFLPVFIDEWNSEVVHSTIKHHILASHKYLLTTRLDNDDAIHSEFIASLITQVESEKLGYYNFSNGVIYRNGKLYDREDLSNAFISRLEKCDGFETVWRQQHHTILSLPNLYQLSMNHAWFQVVHGTNVSNRVKGRRMSKVNLVAGYEHFASLDYASEDALAWALEKCLFQPTRQLREHVIRLLKPIIHKLRR